jgi:hypothetical protein
MLVVVVALLGQSIPVIAQQQQRIFVVRDDDGTPDEGRGHVTSPPYVALKVLLLDRDPAGITGAGIMYYMKHDPYDVATRKLYPGPTEGVKWSNFVVTLNGHEVLRDSLIKYGTEGWHEIPVDPKLLVRGDNRVTMTLDGHGSYFYLGIDRSAPRGRSASSVDYGKTFRPNWLSFGTKEADPGEYMVRLKLQAPAPPEVGFTEKDGHHYGWLEVEDLFSTTRPHPDGFRALGHNKGVNQPSGDLVAYAMVGSFETPLDIPADGQWRLWLRGWMDGFRGGEFTMTWDGQPFYDSAGKHEFTSDANLRFDWLDLGSVKLSQGRHILGVKTTGECGHMFDVLVLTTDPAYRPDETKPLPRMTKIEKLTRPEGLANVVPGMYMTENPIPWGKPLAGGPLRTLWVCASINEREIVELQQRLDLTADVISSNIDYYGKSIFGQNLNMDQGDLLYDLLVSDKPYDVMVLVRTKLDQIPDQAMEELLRRVREGMGLIVVSSRRDDEKETKLSALLQEVKPQDVVGFNAPFDLNYQKHIAVGEYGQGRMMRKPYCGWGMVDHPKGLVLEEGYPFWEYQLGHWVKLLQQAGRRDTARFSKVTVAETLAPGQAAELTVSTAGAAGTQLAGIIWAPHQRSWTKWGPVPCAGTTTVKVPTGVEDGLYHLQANLLSARGEVLDSAITFTRVQQPVRISEIKPEYRAAGGGQAAVTVKTTNGGAATKLPARLEVWGARDRLLGAKTVTLDVAAGEGESQISVPVIASYERLLEARVIMGAAGQPPRQQVIQQFPRPQPVALDDYLSFTGTHENREAPTYLRPVYARLYDDMGIKTQYPGQMLYATHESGVATSLIYQMTAVGSSSTGPNNEREPCLHDPEMWAKEEPAIRERTRRLSQYSPLTLCLGDEMGISHSGEVCFSPHTLAAFRESLQREFGTLEKLNATWQTQFPTWEAVVPWRVGQARQRPDNIAPWLDFRVFMTRTFVEVLVKMQKWIKEEAPETYTGGANPLDESYHSCSIFSQIYPALEYAQVYPRFHDRARSWFRDPRLAGLWSGYGYDRATLLHHAWLLPAYSGTLMCWYGAGREWDYRTLTNTLNLGEPGKAIRDANHELQSGIGKLLIAADVEQEPVAILSAWRSKYAYTALKASKSATVSDTGWDQEFDEFLQGYAALLRSLRVPYRYVDEDQIERGELNKYRLLIAPAASVLSDAAVEKLQAFARQHPVVTDQTLGTYDEHGRLRATPPFTVTAPGDLKLHDFGDRPPRLTEENVAKLRPLVQQAGVQPTREVEGEDIQSIVRKRWGDLRLLVVFGKGELKVTPPAGMVVYDARAHKLLGTGPTTLTQEHSPAVIVFAPRQVTGVRLTAPTAVARGQQASLSLQVVGTPQTVVRVTATGPDGKARPWYDANVTIKDGKGSASFRPALNDATGKWTFTATDIVSGVKSTATVTVKS